METNLNRYIKDLAIFNKQVATLIQQGIIKKEIANELGITKFDKSNKKVVDLSAFNKLLNGTIKSHGKETLKQISNNLSLKFKLVGNDINSISIENCTHTFILFYWSPTQQVNLGVITLKIDSIKQSKFYYLKRNSQNELNFDKEYNLDSFVYKNIPTIEFSIKRPEVNTRTFFVAQKGSAQLNDIKFIYFSYCGAMNHLHTNFSGIGILEHVSVQNLHTRLFDLEKNGIPIQIYNSLYKRRLDLLKSEIKTIEEIDKINEQKIKAIKNISGYWVGYSIHSKEQFDKVNKFVKIILFIDTNGFCTVYSTLQEESSFNPEYTGMITLPHGTEITVIEIQLQHYQNILSKTLLLNYHNNILKGNINGWKNKNNTIFTKAIYFEKIKSSNNQSKHDFLIEQKPGIYESNELKNISSIFEQLKQIEKETMNMIE